MMVPEHLPTMPYTHACHFWEGLELGSVTFVSQSSVCGGWLASPGVSYCRTAHCHVLSLVLEVV